MTHHELSIYKSDITPEEIQSSVFTAQEYNFQGISVLPNYLSFIQSFLEYDKFIVASVIDYPFGCMETRIRNNAVLRAIQCGANVIDLVVQQYALYNGNFKEIEEDIEANTKICKDKQIPLRLLMEYRILKDWQALKEVVKIGKKFGVFHFLVSTGFRVDDYIDNILACKHIKKLKGVKTITNGQFWKKDQYKTIKNSEIWGIRFNCEQAVRNILEQKNKV